MKKTEYRVKEMVRTLQGEGAMTGTAVVLLRFEGCNLNCSFCDTDFTGTDGEGGEVFTSKEELAEAVQRKWKSRIHPVSVLCTGGEPLIQLDQQLTDEFHKRRFRILVETNGTIPAPANIDWICVSPKQAALKQTTGDEIKIVWPQENVDPNDFVNLDFKHYWIQPMYNGNYSENLKSAVEYCLANPGWRLSLQTHRYAGIK
jgi:7-carboxy-7-deazaguanine synthase